MAVVSISIRRQESRISMNQAIVRETGTNGTVGSGAKRELRIRRTKASLWESLVALIEERGYKAITVSDIVARAGINRATFYRYYEDKDDLFRQGCVELFDSINARLPPTSSFSGDIEEFPPCFQLMFPILEEERGTLEILFGPKGNPEIRQLFADKIEYFFVNDQLKQWDKAFYVFSDPETAELFAYGVASLLVSYIVKWLDKPESLDSMIKVYKTLVWGSVKDIFARKEAEGQANLAGVAAARSRTQKRRP
jgi:AcrR family transcriptional regulator